MSYTIDPRVYKLFHRLTDQQRYQFMKELIKIYEKRTQHDSN